MVERLGNVKNVDRSLWRPDHHLRGRRARGPADRHIAYARAHEGVHDFHSLGYIKMKIVLNSGYVGCVSLHGGPGNRPGEAAACSAACRRCGAAPGARSARRRNAGGALARRRPHDAQKYTRDTHTQPARGTRAPRTPSPGPPPRAGRASRLNQSSPSPWARRDGRAPHAPPSSYAASRRRSVRDRDRARQPLLGRAEPRAGARRGAVHRLERGVDKSVGRHGGLEVCVGDPA